MIAGKCVEPTGGTDTDTSSGNGTGVGSSSSSSTTGGEVLDAPGTGEVRDLAPLSDGSWIGVGEADALLADNVDGLLLGFDETGAVRWFGNAVTPRLDTCGGVVADEDGAWVMGTTETADGTVQPWLARLDADSEPPSVQWTTGYPLDRVDNARGPAVARLADGGLGMAFATLGAAAPDGLAVLYADSNGGVGDRCSATVVEPVDIQLEAAGPPLDPTMPTAAPLALQRLELADEIPTQTLDPAASAEACD